MKTIISLYAAAARASIMRALVRYEREEAYKARIIAEILGNVSPY